LQIWRLRTQHPPRLRQHLRHCPRPFLTATRRTANEPFSLYQCHCISADRPGGAVFVAVSCIYIQAFGRSGPKVAHAFIYDTSPHRHGLRPQRQGFPIISRLFAVFVCFFFRLRDFFHRCVVTFFVRSTPFWRAVLSLMLPSNSVFGLQMVFHMSHLVFNQQRTLVQRRPSFALPFRVGVRSRVLAVYAGGWEVMLGGVFAAAETATP
jgi:hypothetical protein